MKKVKKLKKTYNYMEDLQSFLNRFKLEVINVAADGDCYLLAII